LHTDWFHLLDSNEDGKFDAAELDKIKSSMGTNWSGDLSEPSVQQWINTSMSSICQANTATIT